MSHAYDALVIGSGTAGQTAAYALNDAGLNVGLIEHSDRPGGTCALTGCQAKKWFYEGAETVARSRHLENIGVVSPAVASWPQLRDAKNRFTGSVPGRTVDGLKQAGIDFIRGRARFVDSRALRADGREFTAAHVILATGAKPAALPIEGLDLAIDNRAFMELDDLPSRIVFVGGGFISFEFAHFAARIGLPDTRCTILEAAARPLGPFDEEMVALLVNASTVEGIDVLCNVEITRIERNGSAFGVFTRNHGRLEADLVVHGAGRAPDIKDLDLEKAGIDYSRRGIRVDAQMTTSAPHVYAVGDCAATVQLARVADAEAQMAADDIVAGIKGDKPPSGMDYAAVPAVLFTYPQYAMVGKTEATLQEEPVSYTKSFAKELSWPTYRRVGLRSAAYKILADGEGRVLGAHILSDNATGLINTFSLAMKNGITVDALLDQSVMTPYPSRESDIIYMLRPLVA
jgi:glutathione reductase (NADPH)